MTNRVQLNTQENQIRPPLLRTKLLTKHEPIFTKSLVKLEAQKNCSILSYFYEGSGLELFAKRLVPILVAIAKDKTMLIFVHFNAIFTSWRTTFFEIRVKLN